jgi:hypothetical protein
MTQPRPDASPLTFGVIAIESRLIHGWKRVGLLPDEAPNQLRAEKMAEAQQANAFIVGAAFPGGALRLGKAAGFDDECWHVEAIY